MYVLVPFLITPLMAACMHAWPNLISQKTSLPLCYTMLLLASISRYMEAISIEQQLAREAAIVWYILLPVFLEGRRQELAK